MACVFVMQQTDVQHRVKHVVFCNWHRLAQQLQGLGGGDASDPEEMDAMVGTILKQLLSKQVLHQSMKVPNLSVPCCSCPAPSRCLIHPPVTECSCNQGYTS